MIKLSYIVPVYNVEQYVEHCLNSLYAQDLPESEFEVVIINDGSTDASLSVVEEYANKHSNMRIYSTANGGLSRARNLGIQYSQGEYLFFVDSDDYISHRVIGPLLQDALREKVDMLYFESQRVHTNDKINPEYVETAPAERPVLNGKDYYARFFPGNGAWLFLIRRDFLMENESVRFVEGRFAEDGMFSVCATNKAKSITLRKTDVYRYVSHPNSIVAKKDFSHNKKMIFDFLFAIEYINSFAEEAKAENNIPYMERIIARRDGYTFFLQARMIRMKAPKDLRDDVISKLSQNGFYPYFGFDTQINSSKQFKILYYVFCHKELYDIFCFLYKTILWRFDPKGSK